MSKQQLLWAGGAAAVLAGALRIVASLWPSAEPSVELEWFYLVIDVLILFGILGVYGFQHEHVGLPGFIGFLLAFIGTALIVGPDGAIGPVDMYPVGSLLIGVGLVCLAVASWKVRTLPRWVAVLWVSSTTAGIVGGVTGSPMLFMVAGVSFGLAFIGAGATVCGHAR